MRQRIAAAPALMNAECFVADNRELKLLLANQINRAAIRVSQ